MTMPSERTRAIVWAGGLLIEIARYPWPYGGEPWS